MEYQSLAEMFLSQAQRYGDRVLYRFARGNHWQSYTWKEADRQVREIGLGLISLGVKKGDRAAVFSSNRVEWSLIDWANICVGALTVPLYTSSTPAQILRIVEHSGSTILFVESQDRLRKIDLLHPKLSQVKAIVLIEPVEQPFSSPVETMKVLTLEQLQEMGRGCGESDREAFVRLTHSLRPQDDLTIIYTSGTTGEPKGVLTTHGHYLFMVEAAASALPSTDQEVNLQFLPFAHSFGRLEHFMVIASGYTCGFARSMETVSRDLLAVRPTILFSVPRVYENAYDRIRSRVAAASAPRRLLFRWAISVGKRFSRYKREGKRIPWNLRLACSAADALVFSRIRLAFGGRLRLAISGGAPLAPEIAEFFCALGLLILEGYGLTESSTVSHVNRLERYKFGTVGLPLPGVECRIAPDGEVLLRGPGIFKGYYRDATATQEVIDGNGWFHTGDVGEIDADGFLRITERKKDLIVTSGGKKVAPQMIENFLKTDPWISQVMVLGDGSKHLLALITLKQERVKEWGKEEGLGFQTPEEMISHPRVLSLIKERIRQKNKELAPFEAVRGFRILPHDFTVEGEELTPTLKLRRQVVMERYRDLIEEMAGKRRFDL
jgi:long-chain acyl-CoA synthetase